MVNVIQLRGRWLPKYMMVVVQVHGPTMYDLTLENIFVIPGYITVTASESVNILYHVTNH